MTDLPTWRALGPALEHLVASGARAVTEEYRQLLRDVLVAGGIEESDPQLVRLLELAPRVEDLGMQASSGQLGSRLRALHDEWYAADRLLGTWRAIDESLDHIGDPWDSLREELAHTGPSLPEDALASLAGLAAELEATRRAPFGTWPLVATGERRSDLVGQALAQLSERTGIPRDQLPPTPLDLDDEPVLIWTGAAEAIESLHEWLLEGLGRARTLARVATLLPP